MYVCAFVARFLHFAFIWFQALNVLVEILINHSIHCFQQHCVSQTLHLWHFVSIVWQHFCSLYICNFWLSLRITTFEWILSVNSNIQFNHSKFFILSSHFLSNYSLLSAISMEFFSQCKTEIIFFSRKCSLTQKSKIQFLLRYFIRTIQNDMI